MYHGVPRGDGPCVTAAVLERHIRFLRQHFDFISPHQQHDRRRSHARIQVALTFDDGFRNNAEVVAPILKRHQAPAEFFVSSRHAAPGRYLWFAYLRAVEAHFPWRMLIFRGDSFDMTAANRKSSMQRLRKRLLSLRPHPSAMYKAIEQELPQLEEFIGGGELANSYAGMTAEQVGELARDPLFSIGVHTIDHPFLTMCEGGEALRQIARNRQWLESACGRPCDSIAYPSGAYSPEIIDACRREDFTRGYIVARCGSSRSQLERQRIGIYSPSTEVLGFKVQWGATLRAMGLAVG